MRGCGLLVMAVALTGCAHSAVMPLAADTLEITSSAAPVCGTAGAQSVAVRRAAIETITHGYDKFVVVNAAAQNNVGVVGYTPLQATTNSTATVVGNGNFATGYGQSNTYVTGGQPVIGGHHDQALVIKMFKDGDPAGSNAVSARITLGPDWQQKVSEGAVNDLRVILCALRSPQVRATTTLRDFMARAVPSQIDKYLSGRLGETNPSTVAEIKHSIGTVVGFLNLYDRIPDDLINLSDGDFGQLVASVESYRLAVDQFRAKGDVDALLPVRAALPKAREIIAKLPDQVPSSQHDLSFISDPDLRQMIGLDIGAVEIDILAREWKGATILAGSCCEALLLYALQETDRKTPKAVETTVAAISWPGKCPRASDLLDRSWDLLSYTEVAHYLKLIDDSTKTELELARNYRNLIHPSKAIRKQMACDRGTAFIGAGAVAHLIRDLTKNL